MALDFLQVSQQVKQLGETASLRQQDLKTRLAQARELLDVQANNLDALQNKIQLVARNYDKTLRCAVPVEEPLNSHQPLPIKPNEGTLIAADGSQIFADRHAEVEYCLVNTGTICMRLGLSEVPATSIQSQLIYAGQLEGMSDERLSLLRDLAERTKLLELARQAVPPVITFTDGPLELWTTTLEEGRVAGEFKKALNRYLEVLQGLCELQVTTAGYVDKPAADLVVRMLEVAQASQGDLANVRQYRPLKGIPDRELFQGVLPAAARSAVFAIQSRSSEAYQERLGLHFFYLNAGKEGRPYITRVEVPAWVVEDKVKLDTLHAILVSQCRMTGERGYPYLLHRAHETAVVSLEDKEQVTQMIVNELYKRGVPVAGGSAKQYSKDISGTRTRYGQ